MRWVAFKTKRDLSIYHGLARKVLYALWILVTRITERSFCIMTQVLRVLDMGCLHKVVIFIRIVTFKQIIIK